MLSIRLSRTGKKNQPSFRIIVIDKQKDPWGKFLENLGNYNPRSKELAIKADRINYWIEQGAQPSKTLHNVLVSQGIIKDKKIGVSRISKKRQEKLNEKAKTEKAEAAEKKADEKEAPKEEAPVEEKKVEAPKEAPAEAKKEEKAEAKPEEKPAKEEEKKEDK